MSAIEKIRAKLQRYPDLRVEEASNSITVYPDSEDGFTVSLEEGQEGYYLQYGRWHEEFDDEEEAVQFFGFGLSEDCRLWIRSCGPFDYRWKVQGLVDGSWQDLFSMGLLIFPFFLPHRDRFLQNHVIPADREAEQP